MDCCASGKWDKSTNKLSYSIFCVVKRVSWTYGVPTESEKLGDQVTPVIFWKQSLPIFKACVCSVLLDRCCGMPTQMWLVFMSRIEALICVVVVVVVVIGYRIWVLLLDLQRDRSYEFNVEHPFVHLSICLFLSVC